MALDIDLDASDFLKKVEGAITTAQDATKRGIKQVADEILRLSQFEVPHDTGLLQNSGHVEADGDGQIVGYNKVYAAYQHEGRRSDGSYVITNYQKGRKGKFLEDPIKNNLSVFKRFLEDALKGAL